MYDSVFHFIMSIPLLIGNMISLFFIYLYIFYMYVFYVVRYTLISCTEL
jgi:hypothetical protein